MPNSFIPDDQFQPDDMPKPQAPKAIRDASFIPDEDFKSDEDAREEKYGGLGQQAKAAAEGIARGATLGTSDFAETRLGIANPEDIRARQEENPVTSTLGNVAGNVGIIAATGGLAAPAEGAMLAAKAAPLAARMLGMGAEGAVLGGGNTISDASLGDTKINAQKILTDIGMGFAFGAGLGALSKGIEAAPSIYRATEKVAPESLESAIGGAPESSIVDAPSSEPVTGLKPTSIDDIKDRVKDASYRGEAVEMPSKAILEDAITRTPMLNPVHDLQLESLNNQGARDIYKTALEMPGKESDALRSYEALQKQELTKQTQQTVESLAHDQKVTSDAVEAGNQAIKTFTDQYQAEKSTLGPAFEALKGTEIENTAHLPGVLQKMTDAVPGVAQMFDTVPGDAFNIKIKPYKTSWGLDRATYSAVKEAVESLEQGGPKSFEFLSNVRKGLSQHIDVTAQGDAPREIRAIRAAMMDYMQGALEAVDPMISVAAKEGEQAATVRDLFKRYAINEEQRGVIEKAFGASVGSPEFGQISKIKPEMISDRIFGNTATVNAAKNILPKEKFDHLLANWLSEQVEKVTDKGSFSSNKFGSFLKRNQDVLNEAFRDNPQALTKLKDLNNIARILPDSTSINPSGTAKTLLGILKAHSLGDLIGNMKGYAAEKIQQRMVSDQLNAHLAGKADQATKMNILRKTIQKTTDKIDEGAKRIFSDTGVKASMSALTTVSDQEYNKRVNRLKEFTANPQALMDHLDKSTAPLYAAAPNITGDINNAMIRATQFLSTKIPTNHTHFPMSDTFQPSDAQKDKFNEFYDVVNDPTISLDMVRQGVVTNDTMEALQSVHPDLLGEMRQKVVSEFKPDEAEDLGYHTKISLAKFLGAPMDENMLPLAIASYQSALNQPQKSSQPGPQGGRKSTLGGLKELDVSGRSLTRSQTLQKNEEA